MQPRKNCFVIAVFVPQEKMMSSRLVPLKFTESRFFLYQTSTFLSTSPSSIFDGPETLVIIFELARQDDTIFVCLIALPYAQCHATTLVHPLIFRESLFSQKMKFSRFSPTWHSVSNAVFEPELGQGPICNKCVYININVCRHQSLLEQRICDG